MKSRYKLILKGKDIRLIAHKNHLEYVREGRHMIIGYRHLESLYLAQNSDIPMATCVKISLSVPLYFIDRHGYIVASLHKGMCDADS